MGDQVKWGILSTAHINRRVIPEIHASDRAELVAVASRSAEKARVYAEQWDIPKAHGSYLALIEDSDIEVVYNSLPNHLHTEWTVKCLEAGKHVLCEKPMCLSLDEFDRLEDAQRKSGKCVAEALMYLHHPQTAFLKSFIDQGKIGQLRSMVSTFCFDFTRGSDNYRLSEEQGGGACWDVGIYPVSFFQYLIESPPVAVHGLWKKQGPVDVSFWATLHYPGDVSAQFFVSFETAFSTHTRIIGSAGHLDISHPYTHPDEGQAFVGSGDSARQLTLPAASLYAGEVEDMNDVALLSNEPRIQPGQSRDHLRTILALRESARDGKAVILV